MASGETRAALGWAAPALTMRAGDGSWRAFVELRNLTGEPLEVSGPMMATARLLHPDGGRVTSRQAQPYPMPAVLHVHRLAPRGSASIEVALSLLADEKAALPPGRYRLSEVRYGELSAPDVDVEISAA